VIGIALLGAGRMARVHAKTIGAAGGKLVTVYDVVEPAAKSLAADTGAFVARSVEEALHHPEVDAVLVVTSSDTHVDCILQASQAGKAVMCEKPLAPTLADAQRCIETLGAQAIKVFLAFNRRFDGLRAAYLAEAAGASLRLGQAVELKTNCEVSWHE
jgi:myo-inositol 2-dehydrogenase / D-chiro-inositol 1-dehydrogenase